MDVGSTSVHALVATVSDDAPTTRLDESTFLGLGPHVDGTGRLGTAKTGELVIVLSGYARRGRELGARSIVVLGTEPLRRALDAARVVRAVEREAGLAMHVLTQREEALLSLVGVGCGRRASGEIALADVGGGSTEVARVAPDRPAVLAGLALGTARLSSLLVSHDPPARVEVQAMLAAARAGVAELPPGRPREVVAVGGTADNLLRVMPGGTGDRMLTRDGLRAALRSLIAEPSDLIAARHLIRPIRARLLPAGAVILLALLDHWRIDALRVSASGIREGAILAAHHAGSGWRDRLPELAAGWRD